MLSPGHWLCEYPEQQAAERQKAFQPNPPGLTLRECDMRAHEEATQCSVKEWRDIVHQVWQARKCHAFQGL